MPAGGGAACYQVFNTVGHHCSYDTIRPPSWVVVASASSWTGYRCLHPLLPKVFLKTLIHSVEVVLHPPLPSPSGNKTLVKQLCNHFWKPIPTEFKHDALLQCFSRNSKWLQIEKKKLNYKAMVLDLFEELFI